MEFIKNVVIGILLLFIVITNTKKCSNSSNILLKNKQIINDSIQKYKDREGLIHNKVEVLENINKQNLKLLFSKNTELLQLKSTIDKNSKLLKKGGNVVVTNTEVKVDTVFVTTSTKDSINPIYKSPFNLGGWVYGEIESNKDSTKLNLKIKEQVDVILGKEKTGFLGLGRPKSIVDITLHNPYNEVKTIRAINLNEIKENKFSIGAGIYYGIGSDGPQPFIGIGIQYNLIKF